MDFPLFKQGAWVRECLKNREKKTKKEKREKTKKKRKKKPTEESGLRIT